MQANIVIAGDTDRREELLAAVERAGFDVKTCRPERAAATLRSEPQAVALIVCIEDGERETIAKAVHDGRHLAGVPVLIHAAVAGDTRHMADLIALDADAFLEAPVDAHNVRRVLRDVIGGGVVNVAQRRAHADTDESADGIDLSSLGVDSIPPVDAGVDEDDAAASGVRVRLGSLSGTEVSGSEVTAAALALEVVPANTTPAFDVTERIGNRTQVSTQASLTTGPVLAQQVGAASRHTATEAGRIGRTEAPRLLWQLFVDRFTGVVTLTRRGSQKRAWFVAGRLVFVRGEDRGDALVDGLQQRGLLTVPHARHARSLRNKGVESLVKSLVELGYLKRREVEFVLVDHMARVLDATFAWQDGEWLLGHGERSDDELDVFLPVPRLLLHGTRWRTATSLLRKRLGTQLTVPVLVGHVDPLRSRQLVHLDQLDLDDTERGYLRGFDGRASLDALAAADGVDPRRLLGLAYTLELMGFVRFVREPLVAVDEEAVDLDMLRVRERLALARHGDHFSLLGLSRDPGDGDVARAHLALSRLFADHNLEPSVRERMALEIEELRTALDAAASALVDEGSRRRVLAEIGGRPESS